jgi:outer membrane lipoprotein LolB
LTGCATTPLAPPAPGAARDEAARRSAIGRLALAVEAHEGRPAQGFNASFEFERRGDLNELRLSTATGQRVARLSWSESAVELETPERGLQRPASLGTLSRQLFGEELPLAALPHWLAGQAAPAWSATPTASGFVQAGWTLDLSRRSDGLIVARRELPPAITLRVRLESD